MSKIQELNPINAQGSIGLKTSLKPLITELEEMTTKIEKRPEYTLLRDNRTNKLSAKIKVPGVR